MTEEDIKRINEAYVKGFLMGQEDPLDDLAETFKALIAFMFVVAGLTMIVFAIWGK